MMSAPLPLTSLYERDTPMMSKTQSPKVGESAVNALLNQRPVHLLRRD